MWNLKAHPETPKVIAFAGSRDDWTTIFDVAQRSPLPIAVSSNLNAELATAAAVVILDRDLDELHWREALKSLVCCKLRPCVILASAVVDDYLFDEVVKYGGFEVVAKPIRADELQRVLKLAWTFWKSRHVTG